MNNQDWGRELRAAHRKLGCGARRIQAPGAGTLKMGGAPDRLEIYLNEVAVNLQNMQSDAGAFDAWIWVVRHWLGIRRFYLELESGFAINNLHGGRFVFRVRKLKALLRDEIEIGPLLSEALKGHLWQPTQTVWLNVANAPRMRHYQIGAPLRSEDDYELALYGPFSAELGEHLNLARLEGGGHALCRQFPVGVFTSDPSQAGWKSLGPKGKSAIDLIGMDEAGVVHIFELKKPGAISVGALSELLFYAHILLDARLGGPKQVLFSKGRRAPDLRVSPEDVELSTRIEAHLLVPDIHPLLTPSLLQEISGLAARVHLPLKVDHLLLTNAVPSLTSWMQTSGTT